MLIIKELREEAALTQKQLAEKICSLQRNISNWEKGVSEPDLQMLIKLADFFEVTLDELCGREAKIRSDSTEHELFKKVSTLTQTQRAALCNLIDSFQN